MPKAKNKLLHRADIIPSSEHGISPDAISPNALRVMQQLTHAGYDAYLVGGAVRDLLLGLQPKDFDVATNATPEQCRRLFKNARIIGRRFQIVHVRFGREVIEVTTFRGNHEAPETSAKKNQQSAASAEGMLLRDNVFGNIVEDAERRDFTTNALYYSASNHSVYDFCGGIDDIKNKTLRLIGEPEQRYKEDPVRMLRAVRFAAKLGFSIEAATAAPIKEQAELLESINNARLFDESLKLFLSGNAAATFDLLEQYDLLPYLLNDSEEILLSEFNRKMFSLALLNTDARIKQGKTINPAFLWAVFLWPALNQLKSVLENESYPPMAALHEAANSVISQQVKHVAITKRFQQVIKEIWELQLRLPHTQGKRALKAFEQPRFRAAYDFLLLREQAGEETGNLGEWWTNYQDSQPKNTAPPHEVARKQEVRKTPRRRKPRTAEKSE